MEFSIYVIFDNVAQSVNTVFYGTDDNVVARGFRDLLCDSTTIYGTHPSDFDLLKVANIDSQSCSVRDITPNIYIVRGSTVAYSLPGKNQLDETEQ